MIHRFNTSDVRANMLLYNTIFRQIKDAENSFTRIHSVELEEISSALYNKIEVDCMIL